MPISYWEKHFRIDEVVPGCFGSCKLVIQLKERGPVFILPWVIVRGVRDKIEDIFSQILDRGLWAPSISHRGKECFLFLVQGWTHTLLGSELVESGLVLIFAIGLHNMLHHHRPHINTGTKVLAKQHLIIKKSNTSVPELNLVPKAKFTELANVCSLAQDDCFGGAGNLVERCLVQCANKHRICTPVQSTTAA